MNSTQRQRLTELVAEHALAQRQVAAERLALRAARRRVEVLSEATDCVQKVAAAVQNRVHRRLAGVVSRCLAAVFPDPYTFDIRFARRRNRTEADLLFLRDGLVLDDPLNAAGGGVCDVASFALRLVCLVLAQPQRRRLLVLDEPWGHIKPPELLAPRVCSLLETLSREMDLQIILIPSVERYYQVGKVVNVGG